jgi:hypothetical protein
VCNASAFYQIVFPIEVKVCFFINDELKKFETFFPYNLLASEGIVDCNEEFPIMLIPL